MWVKFMISVIEREFVFYLDYVFPNHNRFHGRLSTFSHCRWVKTVRTDLWQKTTHGIREHNERGVSMICEARSAESKKKKGALPARWLCWDENWKEGVESWWTNFPSFFGRHPPSVSSSFSSFDFQKRKKFWAYLQIRDRSPVAGNFLIPFPLSIDTLLPSLPHLTYTCIHSFINRHYPFFFSPPRRLTFYSISKYQYFSFSIHTIIKIFPASDQFPSFLCFQYHLLSHSFAETFKLWIRAIHSSLDILIWASLSDSQE